MPRMTNDNKLKQQLLLKLLVDTGAINKVFKEMWFGPCEVFHVAGIKVPEQDISIVQGKSLLKKQYHKVFSKNQSLQTLTSKFGSWLQASFKLDDIEYQILTLTQIMLSDPAIFNVMNNLDDLSCIEIIDIYARLLNCHNSEIAKRLQPDSALSKNQLFKMSSKPTSFINKVILNKIIKNNFRNPYFSAQTMFAGLLRSLPNATLKDSAFVGLKRDINWISQLLQLAKTNNHNCNILLYGKPGTGKTELSRLLAAKAKLKCYEVEFSNDNNEQLSGEERLTSLLTARHFINSNDSVVVFDELEDAIPLSVNFGLTKGPQKRWFNNLLETNPLPVIWISNEIDHLDPAFLRRFDYCLEVKNPSIKYKKDMLTSLLNVEEDLAWVDSIAEHKLISPADIKCAAQVISLTNETRASSKKHYFNNMLNARGSKLDIKNKKPKNSYTFETNFNPNISNTNIDLNKIIRITDTAKEGRFLLHGVPGTGKTGFVNYLADTLNVPLICKSASDLLGSYVGITEQKIKAMFAEAKAKKAILLLDEADTFFGDRSNHTHQWQTSMVNEMLVQLERFNGVFFASTNLVNSIDDAITRRFDFCVAFDYLNADQVEKMYSQILANQLETNAIESLNQLTKITPADFALAVRQNRLSGEELSLEGLTVHLLSQQKTRSNKTQSIGFL